MQLIKHVHIFAPQDLGIQDILISEGHIAHIAPSHRNGSLYGNH